MAYERLDKTYTDGQVWDGAAVSCIDDSFEDVNNAIQAIHDQLNPIIGCGVASTSDYSIQGFMRPAGTINTSNGYVRTDYIDLQNCSEITVYCKPQALTVSPVVWFDADKNYISGETATEITEQVLTYQVPSGACFAVFSTASTGTRKVDGIRKLTKFEYLTEKTITQAKDYKNIGFMRPAGTVGTSNGYAYTDYIEIEGFLNITVNWYSMTTSVAPVVWFDSDKVYISGESTTLTQQQVQETYTPPMGAKYAVFSTYSSMGSFNSFGTIIESISSGSGEGGGGSTPVVETVERTETIVTNADYTITGFVRPAGTISTSNGYERTDYVDISEYHTLVVHCKPNSTSVSPVVYYDANKTYIRGETATETIEADFTYSVPSSAVYAIFSSGTVTSRNVVGVRDVSALDLVLEAADIADKVYISPSGSDENDGLTKDTPILTLSKAKKILHSDGELIFLSGEYENFAYDLSSFAKVSTVGEAKLVYYKEKISSATLVDGFTRVYQAPITNKSHTGYLWQHNVNDEATAILLEEKHPLQRNRTHRLRSTRVYLASSFDTTSTTVAEFCATIEATTDKYMYYIDSTNSVVYFSAPNADFTTYPIIVPSTTKLTASCERKVDISGLDIMYAAIATQGLSGILNNVKVSYSANTGCIQWDNTFDLILMNCEVAASTNDGINGHYNGDITCFNCWGHDCADDGESDHETCHIIQHGGLYEYNGNGCTPASGASGEYYNCIVRNNGDYPWVTDKDGSGFSSQGVSASIYCIGCLATGCNKGFRCLGTGSTATFINCVSKNNTADFINGTQFNCATLQ